MKRTTKNRERASKVKRGLMLAERLGFDTAEIEGHDLKGPCFSCLSRDAFRIHETDGVAQCYSCGKAWSPFELARDAFVEDRLRPKDAHQKAIDLMKELGFFPGGSDGHVDPIELVAMLKSTPAEGLRAFGAKPNRSRNAIVLPVYGPDGKSSTSFTMNGRDKGRYATGRGSGLFLPEGRVPKPGETWYLVEGVKDAAALYGGAGAGSCVAGLPTNSLPVKLAKMFRGVHVTIIPDRDKAGENGAKKTARSLFKGAASVCIATLPTEYKSKGGDDVRDVLRKKDGAELLAGAIEDATEVTDDAIASWDDSEKEDSGEEEGGTEITRLSDVKPEKVKWLWRGIFPLGKLSLIIGDPNVGKSMLTADIAARVSTGNGWPTNKRRQKKGTVIFLSAEDDPADTIRPRLDAAVADASKVIALRSFFSLRDDLGQLEDVLESEKDVRCVIIDPISAYLSGVDSHKNAEVRSVLAPLANLAQRYRVAVICVSHLNKQTGGTAMYRAIGSLALVAAARAVFAVVKERGSDRRLFLPVKGNLGPEPVGHAYRIVPDGIAARIEWELGTVNANIDDLLQEEDREDHREERNEAKQWLRDMLASGEVMSNELKKQAKEDDIKWRTIERAKKELGVTAISRDKDGNEKRGPGTTCWWLL